MEIKTQGCQECAWRSADTCKECAKARTTTMRVYCMICGRLMDVIDGQGQTGDSHGICSDACEERWIKGN